MFQAYISSSIERQCRKTHFYRYDKPFVSMTYVPDRTPSGYACAWGAVQLSRNSFYGTRDFGRAFKIVIWIYVLCCDACA